MTSRCNASHLVLFFWAASWTIQGNHAFPLTCLKKDGCKSETFMVLFAEQQQQKRRQGNNKPPRFTQQAHNDGSSNNNKKKKKSSRRRRQAWESGKSIDELETMMMKRWGSLDTPKKQQQQQQQQQSKFNTKPSSSQNAGSKKQTNPFRRPVKDPWQKEAEKERQNSNFIVKDDNDDEWIMEEEWDEENDDDIEYVEEYYDQDDEGYESASQSKSSSSGISVSHLISPKPVGGRGSSTSRSGSSSSSGGSYFFNPNKQSTQASEPSRRNNNKEDSPFTPTSSSSSSNNNNVKENTPKIPPLLDENGNQVLLTVEEAMRRFESTVDDSIIKTLEESAAQDLLPIEALSSSQPQKQKQSWQDVGITHPTLLENLEEMFCTHPLSVQEKSTPAILTGNDLLIGTYTGSGKTLAFLVPLVQQMLWNLEGDDDSGNGSQDLSVLIVAPGRELASQIVSVVRELIVDTPITAQLAIGGTTFGRNLEQIRKRRPNILVGTPGRIAELVVGKPGERRGKLNVANLQALVMDEVDALLEYKPHRDPTRAVMQTLRRRHGDALQAILCSATATDVMDSTKVKDFLRPGYATAMADQDDVLVTSAKKGDGNTKVSRTVIHGVVHVPHRRFALDTVRKLLHTEPMPQQILIFAENARKVDIVVEKLADRGIIAAPLHGGMGSEKMDRAEVSKALRDGYVGIVVATELAARGLDAPLLTHVINLDLPTDASHYAHRAGRCGRGGRPGVVINMTTEPKERNVPKRFANSLGVEMHTVEPRGGKLVLLDDEAA